MATLEFLEDENGQQSYDFIVRLAEIAMEDEKVQDLVHRISQMLALLESVGVPPIGSRDFQLQKLDGSPYMLAPVVKDLRHHKPLYEARINYNRDYAFRMIFFYGVDEDGEEVIYFTRAILKDDTGKSQAFKELEVQIDNMGFEQACLESEVMYRRFSLGR